MYHLRFSGRHYDIGHKRGEIFRKFNIAFPINLDAFQKDFGIKSIKILEEYFPEVCEEVRGITVADNLSYEEFLSWMMCMGCCMYNLDDNVPIEVRGCTVFAVKSQDNVYYGRNNDLPIFLKKQCKSELYKIDNGARFIIQTSSFVNGEEGMNEFGLAVAMTFVMPNPKEILPGINSVFIVRYLLEKCKTTAEAIIALKKLPIASSCNILLVDKSGDMVVAECNPYWINIREPIENSQGEKFVVTVNSFSSKVMREYDASDLNTYQSRDRYKTAYDALMSEDDKTVEYLKKLLCGKLGFMCQYNKKLGFDTVWSSIFDLNSQVIYRAEGNPKSKEFVVDRRLALGAIKKRNNAN